MFDKIIFQLLETYVSSINNADNINIAEQLWLLDSQPSMIFPLGKEIG